MGSGKTEYSSRVWRDSEIAQKKGRLVEERTVDGSADRRRVFFVRSALDSERFPDYPEDALAFRGGFIRCGDQIAKIKDSFELEGLLQANPESGTWIIDEASFYDERLVYVVQHESDTRGLIFIFPTLVLNFRRDIFNATARLLLESATDVFPLTAYCEHPECIDDSFYTFRYYLTNGYESPALYFDPLIVIGGDREADDPIQPNYCTRCDHHHYLPGKEYTYFTLKPLGEEASRGDMEPLRAELEAINENIESSLLFRSLFEKHGGDEGGEVNLNALRVPKIAERALVYLYSEANLVTVEQIRAVVSDLDLDVEYISRTLENNRRPVRFE